MPRHVAHILALLTAAMLASATPAVAVVKGTSSSMGSYTVRIMGSYYCSGVVIARSVVVTAAHCANRGMRVHAGGRSVGIAAITHSALLDDGRQVSVTGDAAILKLTSPLPASVGTAPVGEGEGDSYAIAGYGTAHESSPGAFGTLREATLVAAEPRALVDPHRTGSISASACFGDSGGPVMRGGMLVGIITRAAHPFPRIACGDLTRWAAITASAAGEVVAAIAEPDTSAAEPRPHKRQRQVRRAPQGEATALNSFSNWFAPKVEARRSTRHRQAQRY
jgi:hypothetical protein